MTSFAFIGQLFLRKNSPIENLFHGISTLPCSSFLEKYKAEITRLYGGIPTRSDLPSCSRA